MTSGKRMPSSSKSIKAEICADILWKRRGPEYLLLKFVPAEVNTSEQSRSVRFMRGILLAMWVRIQSWKNRCVR